MSPFLRWIAASFVLLFGGMLSIHAQVPMTGAGKGTPAAAGGGCSEATAFLARTSGSPNTSAYTTMICGLVTDGLWTKIDGLYIFATDSSSNALLNLPNATYNATIPATTPTFTANQGYTGNGTSAYLTSGFTPSTASGSYTQNAAFVACYSRTSRTSANFYACMGVQAGGGSGYTYIEPSGGSSLLQVALNDNAFQSYSNANAQGSYVLSRTSSSNIASYKNGSSLGNVTATSATLANVAMAMLAYNGAGSLTDYTADQIAMVAWGGTLNATEAGNFQSRINAYMTAIGANVY